MKAVWKGITLADSNQTVELEGNQYFPSDSINWQYFKASPTRTTCPWKGVASYYSIEAGGESNPDAAWYYAEPKDAASQIKNYVAFWKGVEVGH